MAQTLGFDEAAARRLQIIYMTHGHVNTASWEANPARTCSTRSASLASW
jgi:hypothetical protein